MFWLLWVILLGLIAGWAAGKIMKGTGYGTLGDIVLGILGGIVGGCLVRLFGFYPAGELIPSIILVQLHRCTAIFDAVVLVAVVRAIKKA